MFHSLCAAAAALAAAGSLYLADPRDRRPDDPSAGRPACVSIGRVIAVAGGC